MSEDGSSTRRLRSRRAHLRALGASATALLAGCTSPGSDSESGETVSMTDGLAFEPETLTVPTGATVAWVNDGDVAHTVTAHEGRIPSDASYFASGGFESERAARNDIDGGLIGGGKRYEHAFEASGTYEYYCIPHEGSGMTGEIRVR